MGYYLRNLSMSYKTLNQEKGEVECRGLKIYTFKNSISRLSLCFYFNCLLILISRHFIQMFILSLFFNRVNSLCAVENEWLISLLNEVFGSQNKQLVLISYFNNMNICYHYFLYSLYVHYEDR